MDEMTDFRAEEEEAEQAEKQQAWSAEEAARIQRQINGGRLGALSGIGMIGNGHTGPQWDYSLEVNLRREAMAVALQLYAHSGKPADEILSFARDVEKFLLHGSPSEGPRTQAA